MGIPASAVTSKQRQEPPGMLDRLGQHRLDPAQPGQGNDVEGQIHHLNEREEQLDDAARGVGQIRGIAQREVALFARGRRGCRRFAVLRFCDRQQGPSAASPACVHRGDEAIAAPGKGLNEARVVGGIAEGVAQLVHRRVEAVVVVDEGVRGPKLQAQFLARHHLAGARQEAAAALRAAAPAGAGAACRLCAIRP